MAPSSPQTYATHAHQPRPTALAGVLALIALILLTVGLLRSPTLQTLGLVLLACSVSVLVAISRTYTVRLQDRIIRLEMSDRLERLGRRSDAARVSIKQLVALRFASDAELPALLDRTLAEGLTPDQIKRAVTDWQADWLRT